MLFKHLYDLDTFLEVDSNESNVITVEDLIKVYNYTKPQLFDFLRNSVKLSPGEIYLVTNKYMTQKLYILYIENSGVPWLQQLLYIDMDNGIEGKHFLNQADYDVLKSFPMFADDNDLAFFTAVQEYPQDSSMKLLYDTDSDFVTPAMNKMNEYLKQGLWLMYIKGSQDSLQILGITDRTFTDNPEIHAAKFGETPLLIQSHPKIDVQKSMIVGPYEVIKKIFIAAIAPQLVPNSVGLVTDEIVFGAGYFHYDSKMMDSAPSEYKKLFSGGEVTPSKADEKILKDIAPKKTSKMEKKEDPVEKTVTPEIKPDFWAENEKIFSDAVKEEGKKKKKSRKENFKITAEISPEEKNMAVAESSQAETPKEVTLKTKKSKSLSAVIQLAQKEKKIIESESFSYPNDWDYVYTLQECSNFYNLTKGYRFNRNSNKWEKDEAQTKGMSIQDWNAYFISHPELSGLVDPILGQFGGLSYNEKELMEQGYLLYNPETKKLEYAPEYLKGNGYMLLEAFQAQKDVVQQMYGNDFYQKQVQAIQNVTPAARSIDDPNPEKVPFIHPLDELMVKFELNSAADMTYSKSLNKKIITAARDAVKTDPNTGVDIESYASELQSLSIIIFFRDWLKKQYGKLAGYNIPDIRLVDEMYFHGMSYTRFKDSYHSYNLEYEGVPTESDFYEVKDSCKRFVNDLFQEFIKNEITQDDRARIDYEWNKRYNGFIQVDIYKYPIFVRHSKYFKDRTKARFLQLTESQVEGVKFATINNGVIMALEVGFGKTLCAIMYMSHCFETNQANNIMTLIPKTLYVNKKWREEISGYIDEKRGKYIIGAIPQYNIIEMGNFTPSSIFEENLENEQRTYKNYSDVEIASIKRYDAFLSDIGEGRKSKDARPATAVVPTNAYQYRMAVSSSASSWTKIVDSLATSDKALFNRCKTSQADEMNALLNIFATFNLGTSAKDKKENMAKLADELSQKSFYYQKWVPRFNSIPMDLVANPDEFKYWNQFFEDEVRSYAFERDKDDRLVYQTINGVKEKVRLPHIKIAEAYVLEKLEQIHSWIAGTLNKMYGYAIYEYGSWKFQSGQHNIILATRDSLSYLGFSTQNREDVQKVVSEITTYQHEENYDSEKVESITYINEVGEPAVFKRKPESVLQRQLEHLMGRISSLMTEEGGRGKFLLSNLKIDGFILDEAHIAKKVFTNVKTSSSVTLIDEAGRALNINTSSHDIKEVTASDVALRVFGCCQYIRSLGNKKPVMLLTATPFSNQPTEIFTMLSMVGIRQLREQGISNIKNFFDLFLKENLKYDFDHTGEFIKRISVEEFRNKEILLNLIWSVIDIKREPNLDKATLLKKEKEDSDNEIRPLKIVFPKLISETSKEIIHTNGNGKKNGDSALSECEQFGNVNTVAVVNRMSVNTSSIVDRNDVQKKMMEDIEKVITNQPNPNNPYKDVNGKVMLSGDKKPLLHSYSFEDICPNAAIFTELEEQRQEEEKKKKATGKKSSSPAIKIPKMDEKGKVFKALGLSRSIALSPYLFNCNNLPEPTPENLIKYSPKIEYLVKAVEAVKNHHTDVIPKKIKDLQDAISKTKSKGKLSGEDKMQLASDERSLRHLKSSLEVSGQVAYFNILRFNYYYKDSAGKPQMKEYNIAELIKDYLVKKGVFKADEIAIYSSGTSKENRENYIKDFQEGKIKFFIGTPSMREGVDLQHKASTLYVMTPDWNPTDMRQIEGRIWRRDNENKFVRIVYVLLDQSIEIFIYAKLEEKSRRLQQIMKERNTIAEVEEMSLDPNQTKVALASDPEKRADIITKLCEVILMEKRNKIAKTREELNKTAEKMDSIVESVEQVRDTYLAPFYEAYPMIAKKRSDYQKKQVVDLFINDKEKFVARFANDYDRTKVTDETLQFALWSIAYGEDRTRTLNMFRTYEMEVVHDILNGFKVMLDNKDMFLKKDTDGTESSYITRSAKLTSLNPMLLSTGSRQKELVYNILLEGVAGNSRLFLGMRLITMPDNIRDIVYKEVSKLVSRKDNISRQNIVDAMDSLATKVYGLLDDFARNNPQVRPENYKPYVEASAKLPKVITMEEFENNDLFGKIEIIKNMQYVIKNSAVPAWMSMNADSRKKILTGSPDAKPSMAELIPILNLQDITKGGTTQLDHIIAPINDLSHVMRDINENFLVKRNLTISDLPDLVERFEKDYAQVNDRIESLVAERKELVKKFTKIAEERKSITIDDVVSKFAQTNNYLETKMSYGLVEN